MERLVAHWCSVLLVITAAQLVLIKPELRFYKDSNPTPKFMILRISDNSPGWNIYLFLYLFSFFNADIFSNNALLIKINLKSQNFITL